MLTDEIPINHAFLAFSAWQWRLASQESHNNQFAMAILLNLVKTVSYLKWKLYHQTFVHNFFKATTLLIVQSTELLHLSKSNESSFILVMWWCNGGIMFSNHELEEVGMVVFPHNFRKFGIPSLNMVVCSFVSICVDIKALRGIRDKIPVQNPTGQNPTGHNPTMGIVDKIAQQ